jgi:hypothetical protein
MKGSEIAGGLLRSAAVAGALVALVFILRMC